MQVRIPSCSERTRILTWEKASFKETKETSTDYEANVAFCEPHANRDNA